MRDCPYNPQPLDSLISEFPNIAAREVTIFESIHGKLVFTKTTIRSPILNLLCVAFALRHLSARHRVTDYVNRD